MEKSRSIVGMEVPLTGSDLVKWVEVTVPSTRSSSSSSPFAPLTEDSTGCSVIGDPSTYLIWYLSLPLCFLPLLFVFSASNLCIVHFHRLLLFLWCSCKFRIFICGALLSVRCCFLFSPCRTESFLLLILNFFSLNELLWWTWACFMFSNLFKSLWSITSWFLIGFHATGEFTTVNPVPLI